jgi:hypothetical protein
MVGADGINRALDRAAMMTVFTGRVSRCACAAGGSGNRLSLRENKPSFSTCDTSPELS